MPLSAHHFTTSCVFPPACRRRPERAITRHPRVTFRARSPPHGASASQRTQRVIISILHTISVTSSRCRAQHNISLQRTSAHTRRRQARDTHIISTSHARTPENAHSPTRRKHAPSWSSKLFVYRVRACAFMRDDPEAHRRSRLRRQGRRDGGACVAEFAVLVMLCVCVCARARLLEHIMSGDFIYLYCFVERRCRLHLPPSPQSRARQVCAASDPR